MEDKMSKGSFFQEIRRSTFVNISISHCNILMILNTNAFKECAKIKLGEELEKDKAYKINQRCCRKVRI